jgi:hypothetical protein
MSITKSTKVSNHKKIFQTPVYMCMTSFSNWNCFKDFRIFLLKLFFNSKDFEFVSFGKYVRSFDTW